MEFWELVESDAETSPKKKRRVDEPLKPAAGDDEGPRHSTTWSAWMRQDCAPFFEARGKQKRPLLLESACSGMNTPAIALRELWGLLKARDERRIYKTFSLSVVSGNGLSRVSSLRQKKHPKNLHQPIAGSDVPIDPKSHSFVSTVQCSSKVNCHVAV